MAYQIAPKCHSLSIRDTNKTYTTFPTTGYSVETSHYGTTHQYHGKDRSLAIKTRERLQIITACALESFLLIRLSRVSYGRDRGR